MNGSRSSRAPTNKQRYIAALKRNAKCMAPYHIGPTDPETLQFHHVDRAAKKFCIGNGRIWKGWGALWEELKKGCFVCANCHQKIGLHGEHWRPAERVNPHPQNQLPVCEIVDMESVTAKPEGPIVPFDYIEDCGRFYEEHMFDELYHIVGHCRAETILGGTLRELCHQAGFTDIEDAFREALDGSE